MQRCLFFLGAFASVAWGRTISAHPITDVVALLKGLSEKAKAAGQSEELTYVKFEHWCTNSKKTLSASIAKEKSEISALQDEVAGKQRQSDVLTKQIAGLEEELGQLDAASSAAQAQRDSANALYLDAERDYTATIEAIDQALAALTDTKTATTGLAVARQRVRKVAGLALAMSATAEQRAALLEFIGHDHFVASAPAPAAARPDLKAEGDQAAHVKKYAFKSDSVIELLKSLKANFEDEKLASTKAETNSMNGFSLARDARQNAISATTTSKDAKSGELSSIQGELATAQLELSGLQSDLEADSNLLTSTDKQCALKASEWAERSTTRQQEIEALEAAVGIIAKVTGVRTEAPKNPVLPASPLEVLELKRQAFLQLPDTDPKRRAVQLLREEARETHSKALYRLAQEISAHGAGPFDEVNNMIQKMIQRLMSEQTDEDTHKNWCDAELTKSNTSKANKIEKHAMLTAKIDADTATAQLRTTEVEDNSVMLAAIAQHAAEATEIRQTGKAENAAALKDSQDSQAALANAIAVLEAHYKESGMIEKQAWEFVQRGVDLPDQPSTWDSGYTGVADPTNQPAGIVSVLKKVAADFSRMEAETRAQEETDQLAFEEDMKRCAIEKARRSKESDMKSQEKRRLLDKVAAHSKTRKQTASELESVTQYVADLQHACVDGDSTYADRKAARAKEVEALHEAQGILAQAFAAPAPAPAVAFLARVQLT
jgi:hypothetical protein